MRIDKQELLEYIAKCRTKTAIVEGKKDKAALEKFGFVHVMVLRGPIFSFCEDIASCEAEVMILTDLDVEGSKLYAKLKDGLTGLGVKIDDSFRELLRKRSEIRHIEGLDTYLSGLDPPDE